ncbi:unnamed protein product [Auanema sp. JU1783]|nr:unnamed protein product [Auanema sp. JU1783]
MACALAIPSLAHGIPAMAAVPVLALNLQLELWISSLIWFMDSLHVIMNCIVFVSLNDYYLAQVKKDFKCFVCIKQKVAPPSHIYT